MSDILNAAYLKPVELGAPELPDNTHYRFDGYFSDSTPEDALPARIALAVFDYRTLDSGSMPASDRAILRYSADFKTEVVDEVVTRTNETIRRIEDLETWDNVTESEIPETERNVGAFAVELVEVDYSADPDIERIRKDYIDSLGLDFGEY